MSCVPDDIRHLAKSLRLLSGAEFSTATATAINRIATAANSGQRMNLSKDFTLRNKFTVGSLMMFKATPKSDANKINALVGSKSPYLPTQEEGGQAVTRRGKPARLMPSLASRRGAWGRPVTARARLDKVRVIGRRTGRGMAPKGTPFFWLEGGQLRNKTLFERRGKKLVKIRIVTRTPVHVKSSHWHTQATGKFGRPAVMMAAWGREIEKGLTKLGAR